MKSIFTHIIITSLLLLGSLSACGQEDKIFDGTKQRVGLQIGYGNAFLLERTYDYDVTLVQFQYFWSIARGKKFGIDVLMQPQLNATRYRFLDAWPRKTRGLEFGVNLGFVLRMNILDDLIGFYVAPSAGPHYLSSAPKRQSSGFIFSDNIFGGMNIRLEENIFLDLRVGLRHISNAGLTDENAGINNFIISAGFFANLKNKKKDTYEAK